MLATTYSYVQREEQSQVQGSPTSARQSGQASSVGGSMHRSQPLSTHHSGNPQPLQTTSSSASVPTRQPSPSHVAGSLSSRHPFQPHTGQILHSITPPLSGQLPAATPQSHYQPSRTSPRAPRQVSPCRTMTPRTHGLSPCQPCHAPSGGTMRRKPVSMWASVSPSSSPPLHLSSTSDTRPA